MRLAGDAIGTTVLPQFAAVAGRLAGMAGSIAEAAERWSWLGKAIGGVAVGLTGLVVGLVAYNGWLWASGAAMQAWAAVAGAAAAKTGVFALGAKAATGAMWLVNAAGVGGAAGVTILRTALIASGVGAIVVALGVGAALLVRNWDRVGAFFAGFGRGVWDALAPLRESLSWLSPVGQATASVFGWIGDAVGRLLGPVESTAEGMAAAGEAGERTGQVIGAAFATALAPVRAVGAVVGWLGRMMGKGFGASALTVAAASAAGDVVAPPDGGPADAAGSSRPAAAFVARGRVPAKSPPADDSDNDRAFFGDAAPTPFDVPPDMIEATGRRGRPDIVVSVSAPITITTSTANPEEMGEKMRAEITMIAETAVASAVRRAIYDYYYDEG